MMTFRHFLVLQLRLIVIIVASVLSLGATSMAEEDVDEKRRAVAMRMIGHEVLMSLGDCESRVLPIQKIDNQYKIPFEAELGFDPSDLVNIITNVMNETHAATDYIVEVEQCDTKEVVHGYEMRSPIDPDWIPCRGRALPNDCYSLLITILDDFSAMADSSENSAVLSDAKLAGPYTSTLLIVPLLILTALLFYFFKKRGEENPNQDPDLILIGASQFDKRNMALSYKGKRVELSNKEAELLSVLHTSVNTPIEREVILHRVWGDEGDYVGRTLDVFISKLRKKLEADASVKIVNIRGVGYKLVMDTPR